MTNEDIKETLLELDPDVEEFTVIMSGKKSNKVNGLYKPLTKEIILHNRNFKSDNELMFTAIHEFAHHVQFTRTHKPIVARVHTAEFWDIFHSLLYKAERKGIHENVFLSNPDFISLTEKIKTEFITRHGELIQAFGEILLEAHRLCDQHNQSFDDYVNRVLKLKHQSAHSLIKLSNLNISPEVGYENMKTLARIRDDNERLRAQKELGGEASPTMIQRKYANKKEDKDPVIVLKSEKKRLERTIESLQARLAMVEEKLKIVEFSATGSSLSKRNDG